MPKMLILISSRNSIIRDSTMLQNGRISRTHECWFCSYINLSCCHKCDLCEGATIPPHDENLQQLDWTIFSFGPVGPVLGRSPSLISPLQWKLSIGRIELRFVLKTVASSIYWSDTHNMERDFIP